LNKGGDDNAAAAAGGGGGGEANYKLFSELEAIYKPGSGGAQTGSGSGLTGDDNTAILEEPAAAADLPGSAAAPQVNNNNTSEGKRKRRKAVAEQVSSASASFFERQVQRLMEHQESLHRQFLDAMERRELDRAARDEAWRRQEADEFAREAAARAQDRASAAAREAAIIAYLEKLSGETITLPPPGQQAEAGDEGKMLMVVSSASSSSRWPKHEVEALIRVRTGLEGRFQEPGLKGPLWEEVSARMAAAGYPRRGAKRCKEKWENINKYFRKAKESGKRRSSQAKTCPYFDELDRLYSSSRSNPTSSELLDAVVKYPEGDGHGKEEEEDAIGRGRATTDDPEEESHHGEEEANHH
jgi:hypothetical protein